MVSAETVTRLKDKALPFSQLGEANAGWDRVLEGREEGCRGLGWDGNFRQAPNVGTQEAVVKSGNDKTPLGAVQTLGCASCVKSLPAVT